MATNKCSESKTKALTKAKNDLKEYLQKHHLDPKKNWMVDKVHGRIVTELVRKLNFERDKIMAIFPRTDITNEIKLTKLKQQRLKFRKEMATKAEKKKTEKAKAARKAAKKAEVENVAPAKEAKVEKPAKEKKPSAPRTLKYDYPLIDGKEMTAAEKKAYRIKMRKEAAGNAAPKAEKKEKPSKEKKAKETAPEAPAKEAKEGKKVKKVKKVKRTED